VAIELLYWRGCPSWARALAELRDVATATGIDPETIQVREIDTDEAAGRERFVGSPTIRLDGVDLLPPGADEPIGLNCRVFALRDGRVSPTPDPEDLKDALARALATP
jgi:hypothetical protein